MESLNFDSTVDNNIKDDSFFVCCIIMFYRIAFNIHDSALSNKLFQCESDNPLQVKNIELSSTNFKANTNNGEEDANTTKEVEGIFKTSMVDKEAKLLENQIKHLQNRKRNKELELMEHFKSDTKNLLLDEISLQSLLLRDYEQFIKDERERNAKEFESLSSTPSTLPKVELYDVGKQRPVSAVELRYVKDVLTLRIMSNHCDLKARI